MEGMAGEPINPSQMEAAQRLIREWEEHSGLEAKRGKTLFEHKEVATRWFPNAGPTACPSGRYEPLWAALEDSMPSEADFLALKAEVESEKKKREALEIQMASLNKAIMDRLSLFGLGAGPIGEVREAMSKLEEPDE